MSKIEPFDDEEMKAFLNDIRWTREGSIANRRSQYKDYKEIPLNNRRVDDE